MARGAIDAGGASIVDASGRARRAIRIGDADAARLSPANGAARDVLEKMSCVVTGCAVMRGKPDPEIFTRAREALGVEAEACVVVEDTPVGCGEGDGMTRWRCRRFEIAKRSNRGAMT